MASKGHHFRITVMAADTPAALSFDHVNHDDIIAIAGRVCAGSGLDPDITAATAIGLKLLGEAMLRSTRDPLFDPLRGPLRDFTLALKQRTATPD